MRSIFFVSVLLLLRCAITVNTLDAFAFEEFLDGSFVDKKWDGTWLDEKTILYLKDEAYHLFDMTTKTSTEFLNKIVLKQYTRHSIEISSDKSFSLLKYIADNGKTNYALFFKSGDMQTLLLTVEDAQTCRFSTVPNSLICVMQNNINVYSPLSVTGNGTFVPAKLTNDDVHTFKFNGVPDWIYKEEIFRSGSALWPSTTGNKFVFAKFDDGLVDTYSYPMYEAKSDAPLNKYPEMVQIKYPRAGKTNPKFSLYVVDLENANAGNVELMLSSVRQLSELYVLYDVAWLDDAVVVTYTNREQDQAYYDLCNFNGTPCTLFQSQDDTTGWLDIMPPHVLDNNRLVFKFAADGFDTFRIVERTALTAFKTVNLGNMTVSKIYTNKANVIYFEGTDASHHPQQHVYSVNIDQDDSLKCITCDFVVFNKPCTHAKAAFSKQAAYITRICSGPGPSYVDITKLQTTNEKPLVWLDNAKLRNALAKKQMPIVEDLFFDIPDTGMQAAVRLYLPPGISKSGDSKYPMMVKVYAGPNHNQIVDVYKIGMQHYLTTSRNYIWAFIDGRGSGKRGRKIMHAIYKKLGTHEMDDQIMVTKELLKKFKFIDPQRVGIWGWNNGGFAAAHIMARDNGTFKCGASVAPITNYKFHNSFYTERYMGRYDGTKPAVKHAYQQTDVAKKAEDFKGKNFLLVHATADASVHYGHSMLLAKALEKAGVIFQQMSYPDEGHYFAGVQMHLYRTLDEYFFRHFNKTVKPNNPTPPTSAPPTSAATGFSKFPFAFLIFVLVTFMV